MLFVYSKNSSFEIVFRLPFDARRNPAFENTRMYSCTSRSVGFDADRQLPHAVDTSALAGLSQVVSPRIRYPKESISPFYGSQPEIA